MMLFIFKQDSETILPQKLFPGPAHQKSPSEKGQSDTAHGNAVQVIDVTLYFQATMFKKI